MNAAELLTFFGDDPTLQTEATGSVMVDGLTIEGRIDACRVVDGATEVIDFKTGSPPTGAELKRLDYIQLGLYALMVTGTDIKGSIISKKQTYKTYFGGDGSRSMDWCEYKGALLARIKQLVANQNQQKYAVDDYVSGDSSHQLLCRHCDYYTVCYSKERHQR
jgi:RecB family exonuclease